MTSVDIANDALLALGHSTITALTDNVQGATLCNQYYDRVRKEALRRHAWAFAMDDAELSVATDDDGDDLTDVSWVYVYTLPTDFLAPVMVNGDTGIRFEVRGGYFLCDEEECTLRYIIDSDDPDDWSDEFTTYVGLALASRIAMPLTNDRAMVKDMIDITAMVYRTATAIDARNDRQAIEHGVTMASCRF